MYITERMHYNPAVGTGLVEIRLIWKTSNNKFEHPVSRYRDGEIIATLNPDFFKYSRRGEYLVADASGYPDGYPNRWKGVGEWRIDPKIRGNVRGCV